MGNVYSNYKELNPFFEWSFSKYIFQYQSYSFNYNNEISYKVAWLFAHLNMNNSSMKWSHCISSNFLIIRHEGEDFPFIFDHSHTLFSSTCFKWFFRFKHVQPFFVASAEWWPVRCEERGEVVWSACLTGLKGQRVDSRGQSTNLSREATSPLLLRGYEIRKISTFSDCLPR